MARPRASPERGRRRVPAQQQLKSILRNRDEKNSSSESEADGRTPLTVLSSWKLVAGTTCLMVAVYIGALGYLETRVNTPFTDEKVVQESGLAVPERYWGTYRPGHYFGLKTREPRSPVFGLMWYEPAKLPRTPTGLRIECRHWCEQSDGVTSYGWLRHDGVTFGEQVIRDGTVELTTSFVKTPRRDNGGGWTARLEVNSNEKANRSTPVNLIWYGALDEALGPTSPPSLITFGEARGSIAGYTPQLGRFQTRLIPMEDATGELVKLTRTKAHAPGLQMIQETLFGRMNILPDKVLGHRVVLMENGEDKEVCDTCGTNLVALQLQVSTPFHVDIVFELDNDVEAALSGTEYAAALAGKKDEFDERFEATFQLEAKGFSKEDVAIARASLSNMLGSIAYMHGAGRVESQHTKEPVPYWRASLYTAVPSRSFFPRGFLWDEGFHGLLIGRWSPEIQLDIAAHWFDLMNVEGWIPREQILGVEAAARVPAEFIVQSNAAANPPMFLIQIATLIRVRPQLLMDAKHYATLQRMFTRLQAWYQWFQNTQKGEKPTSYRWRGRRDDGRELNPKTLTSGLDDYPRASHPSDIERHVDLRCWMFAAADSMMQIATALGRDTTKFETMRDQLGDEDLLNELHWSAHAQLYADYGLHTDGVMLARAPRSPQDPHKDQPLLRYVTTPPQPKLVTSAFGYVSLFPMLLKVLRPESPKLGKVLEDLRKPDLLWSNYGLRSLSKSSPLYMKRNTEHDPPYWRGQVWLNINYLALSALKHYATSVGPHAGTAARLHAELRANIQGTVLSEYKRTGYLYEQYSSETGQGSGCKPFTGWTALIVLIMADEY